MFSNKYEAVPNSKKSLHFITIQRVALLLVLLTSGCSTGNTSLGEGISGSIVKAPLEQRYIQVCMREKPSFADKCSHKAACVCWASTARKRLNDTELKLLIAKLAEGFSSPPDLNTPTSPTELAMKKKLKDATGEVVSCTLVKCAR